MKQQIPDVHSSRGFTLAEFLLVVAIAALLVAIAIPNFSSSRERTEAAAELTGARALHDDCMLRLLDGEIDGDTPQETISSGRTYLWNYNEVDGEARPYVTVKETGNIYPFDVGHGLYARAD